MNSPNNSPYSSPHGNANNIDVSEDSDDQNLPLQPKTEFPSFPDTSLLLDPIHSLDNQLAAIKLNNQHEVTYYQQRIEELEANSSHAFKYISEIQAYVEQKISSLEMNLFYTQIDLQHAQQEVLKWKDIYFQLRDSISRPTLSSTSASGNYCTCMAGSHSTSRPSSSSNSQCTCFLRLWRQWRESKDFCWELGWFWKLVGFRKYVFDVGKYVYISMVWFLTFKQVCCLFDCCVQSQSGISNLNYM